MSPQWTSGIASWEAIFNLPSVDRSASLDRNPAESMFDWFCVDVAYGYLVTGRAKAAFDLASVPSRLGFSVFLDDSVYLDDSFYDFASLRVPTRVSTVKLIPFETSGLQESTSSSSRSRLQLWDDFQSFVSEPRKVRTVEMTAERSPPPEILWEY